MMNAPNPLQWVAICALFWLVIAGAALAKQMTITRNLGGPIEEYAANIEAMIKKGDTVRVNGICASACTMYLALGDNICTMRDAKWFFHGPSAQAGIGLSYDEFERVSHIMANHYPQPVKDWFMTVARRVSGESLYTVTGQILIEVGAIKECQDQ